MKTRIIQQMKWGMRIATAALLLAGCKSTGKQDAEEQLCAIRPPIEELRPAFTDYTLNATEGDTLTAPSGTKIIIPPLALVDDSGHVVKGEAVIKYREYHNALDVFLSGIPMEFESNGKTQTFQTAGMFEIKGEQNGKKLKIASGKSIHVDFATYASGNDYGFYSFNDAEGKWSALNDKVDASANPNIVRAKKIISRLKLKLRKPFDKNHFAFNYDALIDVTFAGNGKKIHSEFYKFRYENTQNLAILHKVKQYGITFYHLADADYYNRFCNVNYKGNAYPAGLILWKKLSDIPQLDTENGRYDFYMIEKEKNNVYRFTHTDRETGKSVHFLAEAVMPLRYLFKYPPEHWVKDREKIMCAINKEEKRIGLEAKTIRRVELWGFGIYNIDKFRKTANMLAVRAKFQIPGYKKEDSFNFSSVYCFPGDNKTCIKLELSKYTQLYLDPAERNFRIMAVLDDRHIAIFSPEQYRNIDFNTLRQSPSPEYTFVLKPKDTEITSREALAKLLGMGT